MSLPQPSRVLHTDSSRSLDGQEHRTLLKIVARCGSDLKGRHFAIPGLVFEAMKVLLKAASIIDNCHIDEPTFMSDKGFEYFPRGRQL
jgi:hypothetical protein